MKVDLSKQITVEVPIHFAGKAKAFKMGGIMDEPVRKRSYVFPDGYPELIRSTRQIDVGQSIHRGRHAEGLLAGYDPDHRGLSDTAQATETEEAVSCGRERRRKAE
jgi:hypothetical protein